MNEAEQRRERLLKRILPGLAVAVLYFVFISGWVEEATEKVAKKRQALLTKGVSESALPAAIGQQRSLAKKVAELQRERTQIDDKLRGYTGFLRAPGYANRVIDRLSSILAANRLRVIEEGRDDEAARRPPKMLEQIDEWLTDAGEQSVSAWKVRFFGSFVDVYEAMVMLAQDPMTVVPYGIAMRESPDGEEIEWELVVWMPFDEPGQSERSKPGGG